LIIDQFGREEVQDAARGDIDEGRSTLAVELDNTVDGDEAGTQRGVDDGAVIQLIRRRRELPGSIENAGAGVSRHSVISEAEVDRTMVDEVGQFRESAVGAVQLKSGRHLNGLAGQAAGQIGAALVKVCPSRVGVRPGEGQLG